MLRITLTSFFAHQFTCLNLRFMCSIVAKNRNEAEPCIPYTTYAFISKHKWATQFVFTFNSLLQCFENNSFSIYVCLSWSLQQTYLLFTRIRIEYKIKIIKMKRKKKNLRENPLTNRMDQN